MTKSEILKKIEGCTKAQMESIEVLNELFESMSISADTIVLASILHTINGNICDTMTNLSLILCEMLPEEENYNE